MKKKTVLSKTFKTSNNFLRRTKHTKNNNYCLNRPLPQWGFSGPMETNDETNNANKHNMVKHPNWQQADQLAGVAEELN